jgi:hypothetical protein
VNADGLLGRLDEVEALGFTKGINYESRETLLSGMRAYWGARKQGLPKVAPKPADDGAAGR